MPDHTWLRESLSAVTNLFLSSVAVGPLVLGSHMAVVWLYTFLKLHQTIDGVGRDIEALSFNKAVAKL